MMKDWWQVLFSEHSNAFKSTVMLFDSTSPPKKSLRRLSRDKDDGMGTTVCPMLKKKKRSSTVIPHTIIVASFELCFKSHRRPREQMVGSFFTTPIALLSGLYSAADLLGAPSTRVPPFLLSLQQYLLPCCC